jgi:integrase
MNEQRFHSGFASKIEDMLAFRKAHGYKEESYLGILHRFDEFCANYYPNFDTLTSQIVCSWIDSECELGRALVNRAAVIRHLGSYLNALGEEAYILPERIGSNRHSFSPYIFTDLELTKLFSAIDELPFDKNEPYLTEIAPTLFRLTYTCGLRPNESRELLCENVNLTNGEILITNTKGNKERYVVMSDDMLSFAKDYDFRRSIFSNGSPYFFPANNGKTYRTDKIMATLNKAWNMAMCTPSNPNPPRIRVYDLRHRFASACLNSWFDDGLNLNAMLPYLREFMGHRDLTETAYYIHILPENLVKNTSVNWDVFHSLFPVPKGGEFA